MLDDLEMEVGENIFSFTFLNGEFVEKEEKSDRL
jgi:hypothetical protein